MDMFDVHVSRDLSLLMEDVIGRTIVHHREDNLSLYTEDDDLCNCLCSFFVFFSILAILRNISCFFCCLIRRLSMVGCNGCCCHIEELEREFPTPPAIDFTFFFFVGSSGALEFMALSSVTND